MRRETPTPYPVRRKAVGKGSPYHAMPTPIRYSRSPRTPTARGFSLVEALFASAVLALVVAGLTQVIVSGQAHTYNALDEARALSLGEALMEEIMTLPYLDRGGDVVPGPDSDEPTRDRFDAMDDFHGFLEPAGRLADAGGEVYPERFQRFSRSVTAAYGTTDTPGFGDAQTGLAVAVTVADTAGREWTISRFLVEPASP
jgi:hypothetical protein